MKNNKVEQLKEEILNNNTINYNYLIIKLLNKGSITKLANNITNTKTKINVTSLHKKNYLSGNEQFLDLLSKFIYIFKEDFYFLNNSFDSIVESLLQNEKYTKYLLCKKYIGNNKYSAYFSFCIKRLIICGFFHNIKKLEKKSNIIKKFANDNQINLKKNLINSKKELEVLYNSLLKISICNAKELNIILLFEDIDHYIEQSTKIYKNKRKSSISIQEYYIKEWEKMIKNYYEKIDATSILLK